MWGWRGDGNGTRSCDVSRTESDRDVALVDFTRQSATSDRPAAIRGRTRPRGSHGSSIHPGTHALSLGPTKARPVKMRRLFFCRYSSLFLARFLGVLARGLWRRSAAAIAPCFGARDVVDWWVLSWCCWPAARPPSMEKHVSNSILSSLPV